MPCPNHSGRPSRPILDPDQLPRPPRPELDTLLANLARRAEEYDGPPPAWYTAPYREPRAVHLVEAIQAFRELGFEAAPAVPALLPFLDHPGEYRVAEEVRYWDWTMDDSCKEVIAEHAVTVRGAAVGTIGQIGPAAVPALEGACESPDPGVREWALYFLGDVRRMRGVRHRGEELARRELDRPGRRDRAEIAKYVCNCRMVGDPTPDAALELLADPDPRVVRAALDLTYQRWSDLLTDDQQRAAAADFRTALLARFDDPNPDVIASAVAALMNPYLLSPEVEPAVGRLRRHPDGRVRQQVGNVLAALAPPPPPAPARRPRKQK